MTSKQKAEELIKKIRETLEDADMYGWYNPACKNCALIAVDEQINLYNQLNSLGLLKDNSIGFELIEVKQEIEKL